VTEASKPQPGDVYEEPSGLVVVVLEEYRVSYETELGWWTCAVICDLSNGSRVPAGYVCEYPLEHAPGGFVKIAP
jgi:hypothetical protein